MAVEQAEVNAAHAAQVDQLQQKLPANPTAVNGTSLNPEHTPSVPSQTAQSSKDMKQPITFTQDSAINWVKTLTDSYDNRLPEIPAAKMERILPLAGVVFQDPVTSGIAAGAGELAWRGLSKVLYGENAFTQLVAGRKEGMFNFMKNLSTYFRERVTLWEGRCNKLLSDVANLAALRDDDRSLEKLLAFSAFAQIQDNIIQRRTTKEDTWKDEVTMVGLIHQAGAAFPKIYEVLAGKHKVEGQDYLNGLKDRVEGKVKGLAEALWIRQSIGSALGTALSGGIVGFAYSNLIGVSKEVGIKLTELGAAANKAFNDIGNTVPHFNDARKWVGDSLQFAGDSIKSGVDWLKSHVPFNNAPKPVTP